MIAYVMVKATAYCLTAEGLITEQSAAYYVVTYEWPSFGWEQRSQLPFPLHGVDANIQRLIIEHIAKNNAITYRWLPFGLEKT